MIKTATKSDIKTTPLELNEEEQAKLIKKFELTILQPGKVKLTNTEMDNVNKIYEKIKEDKKLLTKFETMMQLDKLKEMNQITDIANHCFDCMTPQNPLEKMLLDQMAALHIAGMKLLTRFHSKTGINFDDINPMANAVTKLFKTFQSAMVTLNQVRNGGKQTITVKHQNVQVNHGNAVITDELHTLDNRGANE